MVVAVILYLYRNMIVCNSWTYFKVKSICCCFGSCIGRKETMLVCFAWSGNGWYKIKSPSSFTYPSKKVLNSILLYYRIKFSSFRICFSLPAISWFKCFKFSINCNCSYKNLHKKIEPHNVWWCFKSCRKVLNIIKISYVGKEIQCTPNKSQKISTGLMSTILSMSQNTSEK